MSSIQQMMIGGAGGYAVDAVDFDGANDYVGTDAASPMATDGTECMFSVWFRIDGGDGTDRAIYSDGRTDVWLTTSNTLRCWVRSTTGATLAYFETSTALLAGTAWIHGLLSWNSSGTAIYIDDALNSTEVTLSAGTADFSRAAVRIGATTFNSHKFNGAIAEFYYAPTQHLDFSVETNRRKFRSALGKPVFLGSDGSSPTGIAPYIYLRVPEGEAATEFATNRGTGTALSFTGTPEIASTSPSD
jgi:hypothetical protein